MLEETIAYLEYLQSFKEVRKPEMPIFHLSAYTDIEYLNLINEVMHDFKNVDDFQITLSHLKGE